MNESFRHKYFDAILFKPEPVLLLICSLLFGGLSTLYSQNLILNGSMTSVQGENVLASPWVRVRTGFPVNSPDVNDENGNLLTTPGWVWYGGIPVASPDGGTWQNIFALEDFSQTITGLTPGVTYYFRYYYATQGIRDPPSQVAYTTPSPPRVTITGATGYQDPSTTGQLFEWNTFYGSIVATSTTATITIFSNTDTYLAYDGFYLSPTPLSFPLVTSQPQPVSLCQSRNATFNVAATNATGYQWQVNTGTGWNNITDNAMYSGSLSNTLNISNATLTMNNYSYRCKVENVCCVIYSSAATLIVADPLPPSLVISASSTNICSGVPVTFFATPANGGTLPVYQWRKNGLTVGTNTSTYTDNTPANGDIIDCILTSNANCLTVNTATSNPITITVIPVVTPSVTISASANNVCFATPVTFTATVLNGGTNTVYSWFKNNIIQPVSASNYTDNNLNAGDIIKCEILSNLGCVTSQTAVSLPITMNISPLVIPSVSISASATSICNNTQVIFTAVTTNGGNAPIYLWKKNGSAVGTNNSVYTDNTLLNGDVISCLLISNERCLAASQGSSLPVAITVHADPVVSLDQTATLCAGTTRTLDAGNYAAYNWNTGGSGQTLMVNTSGTYSVTVTDINGCRGTGSTTISAIVPFPAGFLPPDTAICSYGELQLKAVNLYNSYEWNTGAFTSSVTITRPGQYWLRVKDNNACVGTDTIIVSLKDCLKGFFMPTGFTPNNDGKNDVLKPLLLGNVSQYQFQIYNRWGQLMFSSTNVTKGWDGSFKGLLQDGNVFVWVCRYQFQGENWRLAKGTVMLIR